MPDHNQSYFFLKKKDVSRFRGKSLPIIISKKDSPTATVRNTMRRRIRAAVREIGNTPNPCPFAIIIRGPLPQDYEQLKNDLSRAIRMFFR